CLRPRWRPPRSPLLPYTTLFRSLSRNLHSIELVLLDRHGAALELPGDIAKALRLGPEQVQQVGFADEEAMIPYPLNTFRGYRYRSEEHTSELQSREKLVCRLLLE